MFYQNCQRNIGENPNIFLVNFGIAATSGPATIHVKGNMSGEFADGDETRQCAMMSVADALKWTGNPSLVKLNIEGGEFGVLEELAHRGWMQKVDNLLVQWHPVVPDAEFRYNELQKTLAKTHELAYDDAWTWQIFRRK